MRRRLRTPPFPFFTCDIFPVYQWIPCRHQLHHLQFHPSYDTVLHCIVRSWSVRTQPHESAPTSDTGCQEGLCYLCLQTTCYRQDSHVLLRLNYSSRMAHRTIANTLLVDHKAMMQGALYSQGKSGTRGVELPSLGAILRGAPCAQPLQSLPISSSRGTFFFFKRGKVRAGDQTRGHVCAG